MGFFLKVLKIHYFFLVMSLVTLLDNNSYIGALIEELSKEKL